MTMNSYLELTRGFGNVEKSPGHSWRWALSKKSSFVIYNSESENVNLSVSFTLAQLSEYEPRKVKIYLDGVLLQDVLMPCKYSIYLKLKGDERKEIKFITEDALMIPGNGDPRRFAFQLYDLTCTVQKPYEKSEELRAIQKCEKDLLKQTISICEKYDIKYFMFYGSLLGALRHQGMVPWDDDIDIAMPRDDYDRFLSYAERELPEPYFVQYPESDCCFHGGYAKIRNSETAAMSDINTGICCNEGIWIDIFPLDKVWMDKEKRKRQLERVSFLQKLIFIKVYGEAHPLIISLSERERKCLEEQSAKYTYQRLCEMLKEEITAAREAKTILYSVLAQYAAYNNRRIYTADEFESLKDSQFDELIVKIPENFQHMVLLHAGTGYMAYPGEQHQRTKHNVSFDAKKSYKIYKNEKNKDKVILMGMSEKSEEYWLRNHLKEDIVFVVDENIQRQGMIWHDAVTISPETYMKLENKEYKIVECKKDFCERFKKHQCEAKRSDGVQIHQILVTLAYGDGVGNDVMSIYSILKKHGYETDIYAQTIDKRIRCADVHSIYDIPEFGENDIILYHLSVGTELNEQLPDWRGKKVIVYHNITPPQWFEGLDENGVYLCSTGLEQARQLAKTAEFCVADSEFNKSDLERMGYRCTIDVLPILIPFDDYKTEPDFEIVNRYSDGYTNILFTGRIAPHKKVEDVIKAFAVYQKRYNKKSRLLLVGSYANGSAYFDKVKKSIEENHADNVVITGHIKFNQILSYYRAADLYLCMSEHEGFCIPLLEAMYFGIPVVAYASTAVPGTLGGSGVLVETKDYNAIAGVINRVVCNREYREKIVADQLARLKDFETEKVEKEFLNLLEKYTEK